MSGICPCTLGNSVAGALFNLRKAKNPEESVLQTASATVISRRVETVYSLTKSSSSWAYLVALRLEDGEEIELSTNEEIYAQCKEEKRGILAWQGGQLVSFD